MPGQHARLSASSAERWLNCPGSVVLSETIPPTKGTSYTEEGTTAHELSESKIKDFAFDDENARKHIESIKKHSDYYNGEMDEATDFYVETVLDKHRTAGAGSILMVEQRLDLTKWIPDGFGTADAVIISDDCIEVCDLKYGKGVKVSAKGNPQLRLYGLGAAYLFSDLYDYTKVRVTVIQPRLGHVDTEELPIEELMSWGEDVVEPRALQAEAGSGLFECGDWCRWCPAKAICRTRAEKNLELAKYDFAPPPTLTDQELSAILEKSDSFTSWLKAVEDYVYGQALNGVKIEGWKLVEGRSNRKFKDELKVVEKLKKAGYDEALLYERKLNGITAMEKLVGKKKLTEILGDLIDKPVGKPVLVVSSDPRPEINTIDSAKEDFKED